MFDVTRSAEEARRMTRMGSIYHRGQQLAWDGRMVLEELWRKHGDAGVSAAQKPAAQRVLGNIMWGELAAWKIAARLADELEPLEARMAATSQAHDEARHFYVMHDYLLRATGAFPRRMSPASERFVDAALRANTIPKKLIGMQLQIESMALTIFHALRNAKICPILSELLVYYEKDEARHVGLGVQLLPSLIARMTPPESVAFSVFSLKVGLRSILTLRAMADDLRVLGVDPRHTMVLGKSKQMLVFEELWKLVPGSNSNIDRYLSNGMDAIGDLMVPEPGADPALWSRAARVWRALSQGIETVDTVLDPSMDNGEAQQSGGQRSVQHEQAVEH
jgi:hypothetical protein